MRFIIGLYWTYKHWADNRALQKLIWPMLDFKPITSRKFEREYGERKMLYIRRQRIKMACQILTHVLKELDEPPAKTTLWMADWWIRESWTMPPGYYIQMTEVWKSESIFMALVSIAVKNGELNLERVEAKLQQRRLLPVWEGLRINNPIWV